MIIRNIEQRIRKCSAEYRRVNKLTSGKAVSCVPPHEIIQSVEMGRESAILQDALPYLRGIIRGVADGMMKDIENDATMIYTKRDVKSLLLRYLDNRAFLEQEYQYHSL